MIPSVYRPIVLILLLRLLVATGYTLIFPAWETLDEYNHYRYAEFIVTHGRLPTRADYPPIPDDLTNLVQYNQPPLLYVTAALIMRLGGITTEQPRPVPAPPSDCDIIPSHFFLNNAAAPHIPYALLLARSANLLTGLVSVWFIWQAALHLWHNYPLANMAALLLAISPPAVALSAWVNNDQLMIMFGAGLLLATAQLPTLQNRATLIGISLLAVMTKLTGIVTIPFTALVLIVDQIHRNMRKLPLAFLSPLLITAVYIAWNITNCGHPLCRIYRQSHYFDSWVSFLYYLRRPPYNESFAQLLRTATMPIINDIYLPANGLILVTILLWGIGFLGAGLHFVTNPRQSKLLYPILLISLAFSLVLIRIWWFPWTAFLPARYLALVFAPLVLITARGYITLEDLLSPRWQRMSILPLIGILGHVLIITPLQAYVPLTTPPLASQMASHSVHTEPIEGIQLVGYSLVGMQTRTDITLHFRSTTPQPVPQYAVAVLKDHTGKLVGVCGQVLGTPAYPVTRWQPNDEIAQHFTFPIHMHVNQLDVHIYTIHTINELQSTYQTFQKNNFFTVSIDEF